MTVLQWFCVALAVLAVAALGLRGIGAARWAGMIRAQTRLLQSASLGAPDRLPSPARFDARELDGLPAPVQRYFRAVLTDGQPIIASACIEMTGRMNLSAGGEQWKPFTSRQHVVTRRPGFLWDARVGLVPGVPVQVQDSYIAGQGRLLAKLLGLFTVAESRGDGEIARAEFMRYFAEAAWYPTALLPSQGVRWQAVDDACANATLVDGPIGLTLSFRFDDFGLIASVHAESRAAGLGKDGHLAMRPWDCGLSRYQRQGGMLLPMAGEAAWVQPEGRRSYFVGHVRSLRHEFLP